jgi:uncharacterized protein (TIGR02246 family)
VNQSINMAEIQKDPHLSINWALLTLRVIAIYGLGCMSDIAIASNLPIALANLPNISLTMPSPESEPVDQRIKQIVERQAKAWETAESDKIIADFAEDSLFIVPGFTYRGKQQIKESAETYFAKFTDTKITIKRIIVKGNEGAVEWSWSEKNRKTGEESQAEDALVFELEAGKIKYWREYIDKQSPGN